MATHDEQQAVWPEVERRMVRRVHVFWEHLRRGKPMPGMSDLDPHRLPVPWPACFLLAVNRDSAANTFEYVGADLRLDCGRDLTGRSPDDVPPATLLREALRDLDEAVGGAGPVTREGELARRNTDRIYYRSILLPFGRDRATPDTILGAVSWFRHRITESDPDI